MALVCQEIQEPHKLPMQAAGGGRDHGQESLSVLQVVEAVVVLELVHLAFGGVDEHAIGVLSMPKRSVATDASSIPVAAVLLAGMQVIGVNRVSATGAMLTGVRCTKAQTKLLRESVWGRFITNRSARASKDLHCIFGLQTSSHSPGPLTPVVLCAITTSALSCKTNRPTKGAHYTKGAN